MTKGMYFLTGLYILTSLLLLGKVFEDDLKFYFKLTKWKIQRRKRIIQGYLSSFLMALGIALIAFGIKLKS